MRGVIHSYVHLHRQTSQHFLRHRQIGLKTNLSLDTFRRTKTGAEGRSRRNAHSAANRVVLERMRSARKAAGRNGLFRIATPASAAFQRTSGVRSAVARIAGISSPEAARKAAIAEIG